MCHAGKILAGNLLVLLLLLPMECLAQTPPQKKIHTDPCSISNVFQHLNAIKSSKDCRAGCAGGKCKPDWTPGKKDKCNAKCGAIFEPFWDQCGEMLTHAKMGGMSEMGSFYTSCLRNLYPAGGCGAFCTQHTYDCYLKELRTACCDEDGNCNGQSPVPVNCPVGCGLVFPTFLEKCRDHIKSHQTESWCRSAKCINLNAFEKFEKKCLAMDGMALVEFALEMKDKGCTINLGDVQKQPGNPFGRRLQRHVVPKNAFLSKWLDTDDTGACDWDKNDDFSNEVDRVCCGKSGSRCKNGGVPSKCTPGCAVTFNQFTKSCAATLSRIFPVSDSRRKKISTFATKCKPRSGEDAKFFLKAINAAKCPKGVTIGRSPPPPPLPPGMCEITVNSGLNGPVVANAIPGWTAHHAKLAIVDWQGRSGVLRNADAGSFSDVYQHIKSTPGATYSIRYDVWAHPIKNTAGKKYCSTTDSNGLLDITNGAITNLEVHGQLRLCPDKDGEWEKVVNTFTAKTPETTLRLHSESGWAAYFDNIEVIGACPKVGAELLVNNNFRGKIVDGTIAGWNAHNCKLSKVDWKGKKDVLRNQDGGGFSEIYQAINTVIGMKYHLSYDVWATPLKNTAGKQYCTTTDSNGLLAITEGAVKIGCEQNGFCGHGDELLCPAAPAADGKWTTVFGTYIAQATETTIRLHSESKYEAYFSRVSVKAVAH